MCHVELPCSLGLRQGGIYGLRWLSVAATGDYRLFLPRMVAKVAQRSNNFGRLQPGSVIGVEVGKNDAAGAMEDVSCRYRQQPAFRVGPHRVAVTERQVRRPELLRDGEGDAIARRDLATS